MVNKLQTISNDKIGRRTEIARSGTKMTESRSDEYGYNLRGELVSATKNGMLEEYAYQYDDIGNRKVSLEPEDEFAYDANELNQYTSISNAVGDAFVPTYDADGNQTLVKTKTGDESIHVEAHTLPLGLRKMVKTGTSCDKGIME